MHLYTMIFRVWSLDTDTHITHMYIDVHIPNYEKHILRQMNNEPVKVDLELFGST